MSLDACLWIDEAVREVKPTIVGTCLAKAGFTNEIINEDPEDNVPLSELIQATKLHLNIGVPMDAADYVTMDGDILVTNNDINGYKKRLLAYLMRTDSSNHGEEQSLRDDEVDKLPEETLQCEIKNVTKATHYIE